jgi:hypothetical protein
MRWVVEVDADFDDVAELAAWLESSTLRHGFVDHWQARGLNLFSGHGDAPPAHPRFRRMPCTQCLPPACSGCSTCFGRGQVWVLGKLTVDEVVEDLRSMARTPALVPI